MKTGRLSIVAALALTTGVEAKIVEGSSVTHDAILFGNEQYSKVGEAAANAVSKTVDGVKVDGQLKVWYQTMDHEGEANGHADKGLFTRDRNQPNEWGNVEAQISAYGNINDHLKFKVTGMTVSTFGMDAQITVGQTARPSQFGASNGYDAQPFWIHEANLDYVLFDETDLKIGRMELNTPLIYTEKWNATANSFESIVATNKNLPGTTLMAGWISKGNGATDNLLFAPQVFGAESKFSDFMGYKNQVTTNYYRQADGTVSTNKTGVLVTSTTSTQTLADGGAVVLGARNKSLEFLPLQAWGYFIPNAGQAYWVQADPHITNLGPVKKAALHLISAGNGTDGATKNFLQTDIEGNGNSKTQMTHALAAKLVMKAGMFDAYAAYSTTTEGNVPVANMGTNYKKTKLPTASIFNDGMVAAQPDTTAWKVGAGVKFDGIGKISASYGSYNVGENRGYQNTNKNRGGPASMGYIAQNFVKDDIDLNEIDVVFKTKIKDIHLAAMFISVDKTYVPILGNSAASGGGTYKYGTFANNIVRLVGTLKF